jgi:hypothetical protein
MLWRYAKILTRSKESSSVLNPTADIWNPNWFIKHIYCCKSEVQWDHVVWPAHASCFIKILQPHFLEHLGNHLADDKGQGKNSRSFDMGDMNIQTALGS